MRQLEERGLWMRRGGDACVALAGAGASHHGRPPGSSSPHSPTLTPPRDDPFRMQPHLMECKPGSRFPADNHDASLDVSHTKSRSVIE